MSGPIGAIFWASGPSIQAFTYETCEKRGTYEGTHPADPNFLATRAMLLAEWSTEISDTKGALHSVIESLLDGQEGFQKIGEHLTEPAAENSKSCVWKRGPQSQ